MDQYRIVYYPDQINHIPIFIPYSYYENLSQQTMLRDEIQTTHWRIDNDLHYVHCLFWYHCWRYATKN